MTTAMAGRLSVSQYVQLVLAHYKKWWKAYTLPVLGVAIASIFIRIDINVTPSLPDHLFITVKGTPSKVERGDYIVFRWHGGGPIPEGLHMCKIVAGVPGDIVRMDDNRKFYVTNASSQSALANEQFVGYAKTYSREGKPLQASEGGVIPEGRYYVMAPHPDSLDSRYQISGLVSHDAIIGRTYAIF